MQGTEHVLFRVLAATPPELPGAGKALPLAA
jgi:hypothetical protein